MGSAARRAETGGRQAWLCRLPDAAAPGQEAQGSCVHSTLVQDQEACKGALRPVKQMAERGGLAWGVGAQLF